MYFLCCLIHFYEHLRLIVQTQLQLYSTVTLRQGEKKHYNHKVDAYSFAIVFWELLHNKVPFEGMSNLQAAYAAAFKVKQDLAYFISYMLSSNVVFKADENCLRVSFGF